MTVSILENSVNHEQWMEVEFIDTNMKFISGYVIYDIPIKRSWMNGYIRREVIFYK